MKAIAKLMLNGRATWAELAGALGLSGPATADRVHRLEERGIIKGYAALIEPEAVGCGLTAFVAVTLLHPEHRAPFLERINDLAEIQECHHIAGDDDYLLKVRCRGTRDLDRIISNHLKRLAGVIRTRTTIVLDTCKETPTLPILTDPPLDGGFSARKF